MDNLIIHELIEAGLSTNHIAVFDDNEIDSLEFYSLTMEDLRILFPNKLGIVNKVFRVVQKHAQHKNGVTTHDTDAESGLSSNDENERSGASSPIPTVTPAPSSIPDPNRSNQMVPFPEITFWPETATQNVQEIHTPQNVHQNNKTEKNSIVVDPVIFHGKSSTPRIIVKELPVKRTLTVLRKHHRYILSLRDSPDSTLHKLASSVEIVALRNSESIEIKGVLGEVKLVMTEIHRLIQETSNFVTKTIEVEKTLHKYVIGLKGSNIMDVLNRTGVVVGVPARDTAHTTITFTGLPHNINRAVDIVRGKYQRYVSKEALHH